MLSSEKVAEPMPHEFTVHPLLFKKPSALGAMRSASLPLCSLWFS